MNIIFTSDASSAKVIGGAERVLFEQSSRLAARGHSVHQITRRLPEHRTDRETFEASRRSVTPSRRKAACGQLHRRGSKHGGTGSAFTSNCMLTY
jgi:hypothetical protein